MTAEYKDRLLEILFYLYFDNFETKMLEKPEYWNMIDNVCTMYKLDSKSVSKAIRLLSAEENRPNDAEIYYLLNMIGVSVRKINKVSGIYWQRQKEFEVYFKTKPPVIRRRIADIILKYNIKQFVDAICQISGIFNVIELATVFK